MAMRVVMTFRGDVICYQKNREWKFIFPTDEHHVLNFSCDGEKPVELRVPNRNVYITIRKGTPLYPDVIKSDTFSDLLNMSGPEMHGSKKGVSNLTERRATADQHELVFLSVPGGRPGRTVRTMQNYWIDDQSDDELRISLGRQVAAQVSLEIELRDNIEMVVEADSKEIGKVEYRDGDFAYLEFNNHCEGKCDDPNEFFHYYNWLEDTAQSGRRFLAGKEQSLNKSLSTVGNCDPVGSDPPPQP